MSTFSDLLARQKIPREPNPEPPGWNNMRAAMMQRFFQQMTNPYGLAGKGSAPQIGRMNQYDPYSGSMNNRFGQWGGGGSTYPDQGQSRIGMQTGGGDFDIRQLMEMMKRKSRFGGGPGGGGMGGGYGTSFRGMPGNPAGGGILAGYDTSSKIRPGGTGGGPGMGGAPGMGGTPGEMSPGPGVSTDLSAMLRSIGGAPSLGGGRGRTVGFRGSTPPPPPGGGPGASMEVPEPSPSPYTPDTYDGKRMGRGMAGRMPRKPPMGVARGGMQGLMKLLAQGKGGGGIGYDGTPSYDALGPVAVGGGGGPLISTGGPTWQGATVGTPPPPGGASTSGRAVAGAPNSRGAIGLSDPHFGRLDAGPWASGDVIPEPRGMRQPPQTVGSRQPMIGPRGPKEEPAYDGRRDVSAALKSHSDLLKNVLPQLLVNAGQGVSQTPSRPPVNRTWQNQGPSPGPGGGMVPGLDYRLDRTTSNVPFRGR